MKDASDIRHWITWAAARVRRSSDDCEARTVAGLLGVSVRTVRAWRAQNRAPRWALGALMMLVDGIPPYALETWSGWRFVQRDGRVTLSGPDGSDWLPADLARYRDAIERARCLEDRIAPGAQLAWLAPGSATRRAWPGGMAPPWEALEQVLRGVVEDAVRRAA